MRQTTVWNQAKRHCGSKRAVLAAFLVAVFWLIAFPGRAAAISNIDSTEPNHWAWNDMIGWIDFLYQGNENVWVWNDRIEGYASSSLGFISLNCVSGPPGSNCAVPYRVSLSIDGGNNGFFAGWAWSEAVGWVSFCGNENGGSVWNPNPPPPAQPRWECPSGGTNPYQVVADSQGNFGGWAWNDVIGWISFNCGNPGTSGCGAAEYRVRLRTWPPAPPPPPEGYLASSVFDTCPGTQRNQGCGTAAYNTIMWQGSKPGDSEVKFQIASSGCENGKFNPPACDQGSGWDSSGWAGNCNINMYACFVGPDGQPDSFYGVLGIGTENPNKPIRIKSVGHNNRRYVRYKVFLKKSTQAPQESPVVRSVIINWSP